MYCWILVQYIIMISQLWCTFRVLVLNYILQTRSIYFFYPDTYVLDVYSNFVKEKVAVECESFVVYISKRFECIQHLFQMVNPSSWRRGKLHIKQMHSSFLFILHRNDLLTALLASHRLRAVLWTTLLLFQNGNELSCYGDEISYFIRSIDTVQLLQGNIVYTLIQMHEIALFLHYSVSLRV